MDTGSQGNVVAFASRIEGAQPVLLLGKHHFMLATDNSRTQVSRKSLTEISKKSICGSSKHRLSNQSTRLLCYPPQRHQTRITRSVVPLNHVSLTLTYVRYCPSSSQTRWVRFLRFIDEITERAVEVDPSTCSRCWMLEGTQGEYGREMRYEENHKRRDGKADSYIAQAKKDASISLAL